MIKSTKSQILAKRASSSGQLTDDASEAQNVGSTSTSGNEVSKQPAQKSILSRLPSMAKIIDCINKKKIFTLRGVHSLYTRTLLRCELLRRGWVEKEHHGVQNYKTTLLQNIFPNLIWTTYAFDKSYYGSECPLCNKLVPRKPGANLFSKMDLCYLRPKIHWFRDKATASDLVMPRSYILTDSAEKNAFIEDYRLTMCTAFLLELLLLDPADLFAYPGDQKFEIVDFAIQNVMCAVNRKKHLDIDNCCEQLFNTDAETFGKFKSAFRKIVKDGQSVTIGKGQMGDAIITSIYNLMNEAITFFPHITTDGFENLWILKPVRCGCGYGITVHNNETSVLKHCEQNRKILYIVQKYLEFPLLIYNTKFDIRQYFLIVMDDKFVNVWMYKNCYLKFSGQEFNRDNCSRAIHVTNHTVQRRYRNGARSENLPVHNMWVLAEFKNYLDTIDESGIWDNQIYPELVEYICAIVEGKIDCFDLVKNNFQLFGADVMITEDYHPVLIEINSAPDLRPSTISTKAVCGAVIKDIVKDYPGNNLCSTGDFELIYQLNMKVSPKSSQEIQLDGRRCPLHRPGKSERNGFTTVNIESPSAAFVFMEPIKQRLNFPVKASQTVKSSQIVKPQQLRQKKKRASTRVAAAPRTQSADPSLQSLMLKEDKSVCLRVNASLKSLSNAKKAISYPLIVKTSTTKNAVRRYILGSPQRSVSPE